MKKLVVFFILSLTYQASRAAPHPLMGSSLINRPQNALAFAQLGFSVAGIPENWTYNKTLPNDAKVIEIGPEKKSLLTFRLETIPATAKLENYVRQHLRDYNQYGFEIGQLQSLNGGRTVVVDLNQKNKATRSRQVFYQRQSQIVIATCSDQSEKFQQQTLTICNQILNQFRWR